MDLAKGNEGPRFAPMILAGGSGTRFWPRSRQAHAKQVLALDGELTMIQQTLERLLPLAAAEDVWVFTNKLLSAVIAEQLQHVRREKILAEPVGRNTAPACALAAFLLERTAPETVIGVFPSDHVIRNHVRFCEVIRAGIKLAASGERIVVLGVPPTRAETGYGYIELGEVVDAASVPCGDVPVRRVKRFTEKPDLARAEEFVASGNYDGTAAGEDRRGVCKVAGGVQPRLCRELPAVRGDQHRLRGAGAALGQGRGGVGDLLPASGLCVERSGLVGGALRASGRL